MRVEESHNRNYAQVIHRSVHSYVARRFVLACGFVDAVCAGWASERGDWIRFAAAVGTSMAVALWLAVRR